MSVQPNDLALLSCALLNLAVFGSAWRLVARRVTGSATQAYLDAALLGYAVQYAAVGLPGMVGLLRPLVVTALAMTAAVAMFIAAGSRRPTRPVVAKRSNRALVIGLGTFAAVVAIGFAVFQADVPVLAIDALTYHFPAAAQWIQHGRIDLFPTWFFNPANAYSPLAGSTFIAWLMLPFGSDVIARFVQVPALLCVGLGVYRLGRELAAQPPVAAAVAAAAVLCRPLFMAELMAKDDLFVAFTFVAALVALSPARAAEPFGGVRLGLAVGLMLALKYTVLLAVPMLLLAADGPARAGWRSGRWLTAATVTAALAAPWFLRNWMATGNPLFPLDLSIGGAHLFRGLFTAARSSALGSLAADAKVVLGGSYGIPGVAAGVITLGWCVTALRYPWRCLRDPLLRACVLGSPIGITLFLWRSPFPEVRFVLPAFLLLLATLSAATVGFPWAVVAALAASAATLSVRGGWVFFGPLLLEAAAIAAVVAAIDALLRTRPVYWRWLALALPVAAVASYGYVRWGTYSRRYAESWAAEGGPWSAVYREDQPVWQALTRLAPPNATVAYTNLYLVYPLQGPTLGRRIGYAPTRRGVRTLADLAWLGNHLSGEQLVSAARIATVAEADRQTWLGNLRRLHAQFLVIGHAVPGRQPIEREWAQSDPDQFTLVYTGPGGQVFSVRPTP